MNEETPLALLALPQEVVAAESEPLPKGVSPMGAAEARRMTEEVKADIEMGGECFTRADARMAEIRQRRGYRDLNYRNWSEYVRAELPISVRQADRRIAKFLATLTDSVERKPVQQVRHHVSLVASIANTPQQSALPMAETEEKGNLDKDSTYNLAWQRRYAKNGYRDPTREEVLSEMEVIRAENVAKEAERPSIPAPLEAAAESAPAPAPLEGEVLPPEEPQGPAWTADGGIIRGGVAPPAYAPTRKKREAAGPVEPLPDIPFSQEVRYICEGTQGNLEILAREFEKEGKDAAPIHAAIQTLAAAAAYLLSLEEAG